MDSFERSDGKVSKYHGAFRYVERIDVLLKALNECTIMRYSNDRNEVIMSYRRNFSLLNSLFKELYPKMNMTERKNFLSSIEILKEEFEDNLHLIIKQKKFSNTFIDMFDEYEINLRAIAEEKGLIMPDLEDDEDVEDDI